MDLNVLFQVMNLLVATGSIALFALNGGNEFVDGWTLAIALLFAVQCHLLLAWERRERDPLLLLLMFIVIPFYLLRVTTLLFEPLSTVFMRFPFDANNMNNTLLFIMFATFAIALGIKSVREKADTPPYIYACTGSQTRVVLLILATILFVNVLGIVRKNLFGSMTGFVSLIFDMNMIMLLTIVYFSMHWEGMRAWYRGGFTLMVVGFIVIVTIGGSRSAPLTLMTVFLCAALSMHDSLRLKRRHLAIFFIIIPIMFAGFALASALRPFRIAKQEGENVGDTQDYVSDVAERYVDMNDMETVKLLLVPAFERAGYLDWSADVITNARAYSAVLNSVYYAKSVIDNVFTPGFDVFNIPKAAIQMNAVYLGTPHTRKTEAGEDYNSEMPTVFGEYYVLFNGWLALPLFFASAMVFKRIFTGIHSADSFRLFAYRALLLRVYGQWLYSYGLDWQVGELVSQLLTILILGRFYAMRPSAAAPTASAFISTPA